MSLPRTTGHNFASELGSTVVRKIDDLSRQQSYATAAQAAAIGLEFDEIKVLVDRLLKDLESVPPPASVGEATGALDAMLNKVADFYEDEVDNAVSALTALMEPLIIAVLGGIIGFIVIAMYMPIFGMADVMGKD